MVKYAYRVQNIKIDSSSAYRITLNIMMFSALYTFAGSFMSYVLYYLFDVYGEEWKRKGLSFQLFDIFVEISILGASSFWFTYVVNNYVPIIPTNALLVQFIDSYSAGLFYMLTIFLFLSDFTEKLKYIHDTFLSGYFDYLFPAEGSILDLSLHYSAEQRKKIEKQNKK